MSNDFCPCARTPPDKAAEATRLTASQMRPIRPPLRASRGRFEMRRAQPFAGISSLLRKDVGRTGRGRLIRFLQPSLACFGWWPALAGWNSGDPENPNRDERLTWRSLQQALGQVNAGVKSVVAGFSRPTGPLRCG